MQKTAAETFQEKGLVIATGNRAVLKHQRAMYTTLNDDVNVWSFDPEKPLNGSEYVEEPREEPTTATLFKIHRMLDLFQAYKHSSKENNEEVFNGFPIALAALLNSLNMPVIFAADVGFHSISQGNETVGFRLDRGTKGSEISLNETEKMIQTLFHQYKKAFTANWEVSFGVHDGEKLRMLSLELTANFEGLTEETIREYFYPRGNTGLRLLPLAQDLQLPLYLKLADEQHRISYDLARQIIIGKTPTKEMMDLLLTGTGELQQDDTYGEYEVISLDAPGAVLELV